MFGYIRTDTPELRVRENEYYRAVYCGLCRAQGKCTGQCSRFTLSYDMAFLALVRMAVCGTRPDLDRKRCIAHPLRKRSFVKRNDQLDICAYTSALLTLGKLKDDLADERGTKKLRARLMMPYASYIRKKAYRHGEKSCGLSLSELEKTVSQKLSELSRIESERRASVDTPAEIFGELMADIAAFGLDGERERLMRSIGKHLGKWVYITDAADDAEEDREKGRYNPFLCLYDGQLPGDDEKKQISDALRLELAAAIPAFDLIDYDGRADMEGIINNVLYLGMPGVADKILFGDKRGNCKKKKANKPDREKTA